MTQKKDVPTVARQSPAAAEQDRLVAAISEPIGDPPLSRLTLTLAAINNANKVLIMISGHERRLIFEEIIASGWLPTRKYPAALVKPRQELTWLVCP
ncbi:MAG: hypothetical protein EYX74_05345 [Desulfobulbaceae bacterium]|nr:MAG: hypothetical protein EYX74_05345 [Desulfobulbaceae bacterium]